ncbi:unnamed protein product [Vitrella brassicaformis CCMP3155]|uniref:RRM domain-containing protein n=2 Tax=Vitrella brassicaformis TaxID=1169539 RepID=A0A0G4EPY7_VITBC|nr:unnamed protein product [Vitrella brassicaformis CCMP3155]|eukprot:CEL99920.1 unnamed protein product [Vitrella brassicaformis CCMP3155]
MQADDDAHVQHDHEEPLDNHNGHQQEQDEQGGQEPTRAAVEAAGEQQQQQQDGALLPEDVAMKGHAIDGDVNGREEGEATPAGGANGADDGGGADGEREVEVARGVPSPCLVIYGFVRPFTEKSVRSLLEETGTIRRFWMDSIKTHCLVEFETEDDAIRTKDALTDVVWPKTSSCVLEPHFATQREMDDAEAGKRKALPPRTLNVASPDAQPTIPGVGAHPSRSPLPFSASHPAGQKHISPLPPGRTPDGMPVPFSKAGNGGAVPQANKTVEALDRMSRLFKKTKPCPYPLYWLPVEQREVLRRQMRRVRPIISPPDDLYEALPHLLQHTMPGESAQQQHESPPRPHRPSTVNDKEPLTPHPLPKDRDKDSPESPPGYGPMRRRDDPHTSEGSRRPGPYDRYEMINRMDRDKDRDRERGREREREREEP